MSKLAKNSSLTLNKNFYVFSKTGGFNLQDKEKNQVAIKRQSGRLFLNDGKITKYDGSLRKTLGDIAGYSLEDLFIDNCSSKIKLNQLESLGKVDVRLMDGNGAIFWARLSRNEDLIHVEDIDVEKNFQLSSEDMIESYERGEDLSSLCEGQTFQ